MDQYELLSATQKAIGDSTLYQQHQQLVTRREELRALTTVLGGCWVGCRAVGRHGQAACIVTCWSDTDTCVPFWRPVHLAIGVFASSATPNRQHGKRRNSRPATHDPLPTRAQSLAAQQKQLDKLEAENRALERDAERFRRRQTLQKQIGDIRTKARGMPLDGQGHLLLQTGSGTVSCRRPLQCWGCARVHPEPTVAPPPTAGGVGQRDCAGGAGRARRARAADGAGHAGEARGGRGGRRGAAQVRAHTLVRGAHAAVLLPPAACAWAAWLGKPAG